MEKKKGISSKVIIIISLLFFYLPIVYIIIFSFNSSRSLTSFGGFSLRWYQKMFADKNMIESLLYTIIVAILATIISTVAGTITSIGLSKSKRVLQSMVENVNSFPVMNPEIVTAIGLLMFFSALTVRKGFGTMLIAHIMFCIPYVMLSVSPKLKSLDPNLTDAALDLGATPFQALTKVIVPQIKPGIISGALIAFTMSFDDFIISYFVTGNGVQNISILVYTMSKRINPSINALSTIIIAIITIVLLVVKFSPAARTIKDGASSGGSNKARYIVLGVVVAAVIAGCGAGISALGSKSRDDAIAKYGSDTLKFYNWGEYIGEDVIENFEDEFGVKVICEYFDSNEMMYTKIQSGESYDVLVPSDYMIERLIASDYLMELDLSLIPNLSNVTEGCRNLDFDPDNTYSVPYFWGTVGIVYNTEKVPYEELEEKGFSILKDTKYKGRIFMYDSERDSFMIALKSLGYSMNTNNMDEIMEAYEWLLDLNNTMAPVYVLDEVIDSMSNGIKDMAIVYSGDATVILDENEDMGYFMPYEGTNLWSDGMVIPKNAQNPLLAHEFINYILTYEASYDNSATVGYASSNEEVLLEMSGPEGMFEENEAYLPRMGYEKDEIFRDDPVLKKTLSELWIKVKAVN